MQNIRLEAQKKNTDERIRSLLLVRPSRTKSALLGGSIFEFALRNHAVLPTRTRKPRRDQSLCSSVYFAVKFLIDLIDSRLKR